MWPAGVVSISCRRPGRIRECQPAACLAWLQDSHRPCPLVSLGGAAVLVGWTLATCRTGASSNGVRQKRSRSRISRAIPSGNPRRALRPMRASWGAGVPHGCCIREAGAVSRRQRLDVASARPALASTRWRSMARYTVERPTPKSSATSRVLYSPLCTRETRCASGRRLSWAACREVCPWPSRPSYPLGCGVGSGRTRTRRPWRAR